MNGMIDFKEPWYPVVDPEVQAWAQGILHREVAEGHILFGRTADAILFARRQDQDDFAYLLADGTVATVHLTFTRMPPDNPPWPGTSIDESIEAWVRECMIPDHEYFCCP